MYRRSLVAAFSKQARSRTVVRDPRKKRMNQASDSLAPVATREDDHRHLEPSVPPQTQVHLTPLPFQPSQHNQQSIGSSLASYALAGVGVTLGVVLVRVVLGF
jgi:hypothetical protein